MKLKSSTNCFVCLAWLGSRKGAGEDHTTAAAGGIVTLAKCDAESIHYGQIWANSEPGTRREDLTYYASRNDTNAHRP